MFERSMVNDLVELITRLRRALYAVLIVFILTFAFKITLIKVDPLGTYIPILEPSVTSSIAVQFTKALIHSIVPRSVEVITISPFDPLIASAQISLFLAVIVALPVVLWEFWAFVSPGLYEHERSLLKASVIPAMVLFTLGALFAYTIIIPELFKFFLFFAQSLGVAPVLSIRSTIQLILALILAMGLAFQTPLIMIMLTRFGIVKASTWRRNWRWGVLAAFVFALIVSPGTTGGVIETIIGLTISALYLVGMAVASLVERGKGKAH